MRIAAVCGALLAVISLVPAQGSDSPVAVPSLPVRFDPSRDAAADIRSAVNLAQRTGKRVLLDVGGEWCIWCRRLDTLFATHVELAEFRDRQFVTVKVNYSKENKNEKVLSAYPKIPGYPHLFVLDSSGALLHSQETGALESGKGHDPRRVMDFLRKWSRQ